MIKLKARITAAIKTFTPDRLLRVYDDLDYRVDIVQASSGDHIEYFLNVLFDRYD